MGEGQVTRLGEALERVRPWLMAVLGAVVAMAAAVGTWAVVEGMRMRLHADKATAAAEREERQAVSVHVTLAPLPQSLPLLGAAGTDADGYPLQYVDRAGLRTLLDARRFKELTSYFEQLQSAFEADPRKEYWPADAGDAFQSAEPELVAALDAWVTATPTSFAPYYARGNHYRGAMWARRGGQYASDTPDDDFREMREAAERAVADLDRAIELRPGLVAAMRDELNVSLATSDSARATRMSERAFGTCRSCLQVRAAYLELLTPRWGGSYAEIDGFVSRLSPGDNPRFRALRGYADLERASELELSKRADRYDQALGVIESALGKGEYWEYLLFKGDALRRLGRVDESLVSFDRADALRPMHPSILAERAALRCNRKEYVSAGRDLLTALRIDPTAHGKHYATDVVHGLLAEARQLESEGKRTDAVQETQLLLELCPDDGPAKALYEKLANR